MDTSAPGKWKSKLPEDERNAVINIYGSHSTAEVAVEELQKANFDVQGAVVGGGLSALLAGCSRSFS